MVFCVLPLCVRCSGVHFASVGWTRGRGCSGGTSCGGVRPRGHRDGLSRRRYAFVAQCEDSKNEG